MIVLLADEPGVDERATFVGKLLHEQRRESWDAYVAFLRTRYQREVVLAEHAAEWSALTEGMRGGTPAWRDDDQEITGRHLAPKTVALTFDDGPSAKTTPQVLEILAKN